MAIPSGSGTEVLNRAVAEGMNATTTTLLTVPTDHIYTILSIILFNPNNDAKEFSIVFVAGGSTTMNITGDNGHPIPANSTFTWNDKFVMRPADILKIYTDCTAGDCIVSYIDQDWT